jgi:AAA15 family ATPase/GTPase
MFQNLKVKEIKALKEAYLLNLGKINIVCGKNSSGKSTLLEAILNDSKVSVGTIFDNKQIELLKNSYGGLKLKEGFTWGFGAPPDKSRFLPSFFKALDLTLNEEKVYFNEDLQEISENLSKAFNRLENSQSYILLLDKFNQVFDNLFKFELPNRILLPPKRNLESEELYQHRQEVKNNGEWLLNKLFFAKNQPNTSDDFKLYHKIKAVFSEITIGHTFDLVADTIPNQTPATYVVKLKFALETQNEWVDASNCGLGLRDLLVILYFAISPEYKIVLMEEPENHIHPEMQRKLLKFLKEETNKQYFIATHSNVFLNSTYVDRVFFTEYENGEIKVSDATSRAKVLHSLGYSVTDNLVSDLIILVEGSGDKDFIEEFLSKLGLDARYNIKIWILGGDEMVNQDLSAFKQDYKIMALVDKDLQSEKNRWDLKSIVRNTTLNFINLKDIRLKVISQ